MGEQSGELTERESTDLVRPDESHEERLLRVRKSMADSRRQIADSLDRLRGEVRDAVDWRAWVDDHPVEAVGIAFGLGFMIGFR